MYIFTAFAIEKVHTHVGVMQLISFIPLKLYSFNSLCGEGEMQIFESKESKILIVCQVMSKCNCHAMLHSACNVNVTTYKEMEDNAKYRG